MKLNFGIKHNYGTSVKDLPNITKHWRFIILSEITSDTIENITDMIFNLLIGTDYLTNEDKRTRVMVINNSEVYGSYHNKSMNTRARNVHIHHGMTQCDINSVTGETPIIFTDMDYNVIYDRPSDLENKRIADCVSDIIVSYDQNEMGNQVFRKTEFNNNKYSQVLLPQPIYYDEMDMVLLGDHDESYTDEIFTNKENIYSTNPQKYINNLFTTNLNQLIDDHTQIYKLNIKIDYLSPGLVRNVELDNLLSDMCGELKYNMEKAGFSSAEIILSGNNGFNITPNLLKTYLNLNKWELHISYGLLLDTVSFLNNQLIDCDDIFLGHTIVITINHSNINIKLMSVGPDIGITKTDSNVKQIGDELKTSGYNYIK